MVQRLATQQGVHNQLKPLSCLQSPYVRLPQSWVFSVVYHMLVGFCFQVFVQVTLSIGNAVFIFESSLT